MKQRLFVTKIALILICLIILPINSAKAASLPSTAKNIYNLNLGVGLGINIKFELLSRIQSSEKSQSVDVGCAAVYRKWNIKRVANTEDIPGWIEGTVAGYCVPRDLRQQQLSSLQQSCTVSPQKECFEPSFLDALKSVTPTQYIDLN
jgi:hypothetical protein